MSALQKLWFDLSLRDPASLLMITIHWADTSNFQQRPLPTNETIAFRQKALELVLSRLKDGTRIDDGTISAVGAFACCEVCPHS
jgi:hypothetical protein